MDTLVHQPKIWLTDKEQREIKDQQCHLPKKWVCYQGSFSDQLHALLGCDTTSWLFGIWEAAAQRNLRRPSCLTVSRDTSIEYYKESRQRIFSLWDTRWYACETPVIHWWELCVRHVRHLDMGSLKNVSVHVLNVVSYRMSRFDQRLRNKNKRCISYQ